MKHNIKSRFGFTLFEVVVTMGIVAVFIAACSNVFTQQHKNRVANPAHGRVECYWQNDQLHQRTFFENMLAGDDIREDGKCIFTPTRSAAYVMVYAVGGGGAGGPIYGGSDGEFLNMFLPITTHHLELIPGRGAKNTPSTEPEGAPQIDTIGQNTVVNDIGLEGNDSPSTVINLPGGLSNSFGSTSGTVNLGDCTVVYARYSCGLPYSCEADNVTRKVHLRYCTGNDAPQNNPEKDVAYRDINYSDILSNYTTLFEENNSELTIGFLRYEQKTDMTDYCDINSYNRDYIIALRVVGNNTPYEKHSPMEGCINALAISTGIATVNPKPGNGGAINSNGGDGAVIVVW